MNNQQIFKQWYIGIRIPHVSHKLASTHYEKINKALGILVVITTTLVGTTLFATLESSQNTSVQITIGLLSITSAILSALQTFLNFSELAGKHKIAATKYGELRREFDIMIISSSKKEQDFEEFLKNFRLKWNQIDLESPTIPKNIYIKARDAIKNSNKDFEELFDFTISFNEEE